MGSKSGEKAKAKAKSSYGRKANMNACVAFLQSRSTSPRLFSIFLSLGGYSTSREHALRGNSIESRCIGISLSPSVLLPASRVLPPTLLYPVHGQSCPRAKPFVALE